MHTNIDSYTFWHTTNTFANDVANHNAYTESNRGILLADMVKHCHYAGLYTTGREHWMGYNKCSVLQL
jgi:hypothetical protein